MIGSCQHVLIQEYVRLLNSWCEWNNCSSKSIFFNLSSIQKGYPDSSSYSHVFEAGATQFFVCTPIKAHCFSFPSVTLVRSFLDGTEEFAILKIGVQKKNEPKGLTGAYWG